MSKDYKIYGKIISGINKDYPPRVKSNFTDSVMSKVYNSSKSQIKTAFTNYINVAASVVIAVMTSLLLVSFESQDDKLVTGEFTQPDEVQSQLINKVIDENSCMNTDNNEAKISKRDECK